MPRLFIALDLPLPPCEIRAALAPLQTGVAGARWIPLEQMHVTLRFLGSVPEPEATALAARLAGVNVPVFTLQLAGVGAFSQQVLWAGLSPGEPVVALKGAIDGVLGPDPESATRSFSPHLTLARLRDPVAADVSAFLDRHRALASVAWVVDSFHLYESRTLQTGPVYTRRATYALRPSTG